MWILFQDDGDGAVIEFDDAGNREHADRGEELLDNFGREFVSPHIIERPRGIVSRHGFGMRTLGGHRVVAIGDAGDACECRNAVAEQAFRIASAIGPLLVAANHVGNVLRDAPGAGQDFHAQRHVAAQGVVLLHG